MPETIAEGGCLCGAVRYRVEDEPTVSMICHCRSCTRAAGSPAVAWVSFRRASFSFTRGEPAKFHSSPPVTRTFCGSCGTPLTYEHRERGSETDVTTSSLDHPERFPPTHHSWVGDGPGWDRFGDGLPAHDKESPKG